MTSQNLKYKCPIMKYKSLQKSKRCLKLLIKLFLDSKHVVGVVKCSCGCQGNPKFQWEETKKLKGKLK